MSGLFSENISLEIDHAKRRMLFAQVGALDMGNILQSYRMIHAAEGFNPSYDTLVDYRGITEVNLGPQDPMHILKEIRGIEKRTGRGAVVIGHNIGRLSFAKFFCELSAKFDSAMIRWKEFRIIEDAETWLDSDG